MAAIHISAPGEDYGPCVNERCGHSDCEQNRNIAATLCTDCGEAIGYDRRFFNDGEFGTWDRLVHMVCLAKRMQRNREAKAL